MLATQNANGLTFAVTAGQTYTVRLDDHRRRRQVHVHRQQRGGGGGGGGDVQPSFTDWGVVDFSQYNDVVIGGERWFRVEAARTGNLSVLGQYAGSNAATVSIYNSNMQLIAGGVASGSTTRSDVQATAGAEYFIRVTGSATDVDVSVVNLVSQSGLTVSVAGTSGNDVYSFAAGGAQVLTVNGVQYQFATSSANQFNFQGGGGADVITLVGSTGNEIANALRRFFDAGRFNLRRRQPPGSKRKTFAAAAASTLLTSTIPPATTPSRHGPIEWCSPALAYTNEARDFDNAKAFATAAGRIRRRSTTPPATTSLSPARSERSWPGRGTSTGPKGSTRRSLMPPRAGTTESSTTTRPATIC